MKHLVPALAILVAALLGNLLLEDNPYRLARVGYPQDQAVLDHQDSPYSHVTWVISETENYAQLRFFNRVEGGVCLRPSWADLGRLADTLPAAQALCLQRNRQPKDFDLQGRQPADTWPTGRAKPDPGTLTNSKYVTLYPLAVLFNRHLREANPDIRLAPVDIMMIGLGSGVGISVLAHHFPEASITVVDIDPVVVNLVYGHYPFLRWLATQTTSDGRPRLRMGEEQTCDARVYARHVAVTNNQGRPFDVVIIDAYTDGSTIPPHLMTREFYQDIRGILAPDGIVLSNIIGSYGGPVRNRAGRIVDYEGSKRLVLGGAIRTMMAAGLTEVHNFPILHNLEDPQFTGLTTANNVVLASTKALDPDHAKPGWEAVEAFQPYPEFKPDRYLTRKLILMDDRDSVSSFLGIGDDQAGQELAVRLDALLGEGTSSSFAMADITEPKLAEAVRAYLDERNPDALGWNAKGTPRFIRYDWVLHARETWQTAMHEARSSGTGGRRYKHAGTTLVPVPDATGTDEHTIPDAPVFTDARPNADIYNR